MACKKVNFCPAESEVLLILIDKYKHVIECKRTDAVFNKKKREAWTSLARDFNEARLEAGSVHRSVSQLHNRYKSMKKEIKKSTNSTSRCSSDTVDMEKRTGEDDLESPNEQMPRIKREDDFEVALPDNSLPSSPNFEDSRSNIISFEIPQLALPRPSEARSSKTKATKKSVKCLIGDYAKERHLAFQKEIAQNLRIKEEEHELKMKVLEAKLNYYNALTKSLTKEK